MTSLLHSRPREQIFPRVSRRHCLQFLHQIPHTLVGRRRHDDLYFDILIASRAVPRAGHAFFFQPQRLPAIRSRRNAHAPAVCDSGWNAHINRLRAPHAPFAAAGLACGSKLARSAAARARHVELHLAGLLLNRSRSMASRARLRRAHRSCSMTGLAGIQARDGEFLHRAAHGIPEIDLDLVFQVAARFVLRFHRGTSAAATEKLAEEITEACSAARCSRPAAEIESTEVKINIWRFAVPSLTSSGSAGRNVVAVKAVLVVDLSLLRIGEHVVGFLQLLEFFFRGLVAGIQVRVILSRQLAKRRANILRRRFARHTQQFVIVSFGGCWHACAFSGAKIPAGGPLRRAPCDRYFYLVWTL